MTLDTLVVLVVYIVLFAVVAYGAHWVCIRFQMPAPVFWAVGALLLVFLLLFIVREIGGVPGLNPVRR